MIKLPRRAWTQVEIGILRDLYPKIRPFRIAEKLGRSIASVTVKAAKLGIAQKGQISEEARLQASYRMKEMKRIGTVPNRGPMTEAEKEIHRQRFLKNRPQRLGPMSVKQKQMISERMKIRNPMKRPEIVKKVVAAKHANGSYQRLALRMAELHKAGKILHPIMTAKGRQKLSQSMKENNPMKNPEVVQRVRLIRLWRNFSNPKAMAKAWIRAGIAPNRAELLLAKLILPLGFRFVGDGSFWIGPCQSGHCRNPDFIYKSGRNKQAILLNGEYWHLHRGRNDQEEMTDYKTLGWQVLVIWGKELATPSDVINKITHWLNGQK